VAIWPQKDPPMKTRAFIASIAVLFLATGVAHADSEKWEAN